ncbi:hypothetical protein ACHAXS_011085 [Conticribra weissflogii]
MKKRNLHVPVGSETMIQIAVLVGICAHWLGCLNFMCTRLRNFPSESWLVKFELNEKNLVTQWRCAVLRSIVHLTELLSVEPTPEKYLVCDSTKFDFQSRVGYLVNVLVGTIILTIAVPWLMNKYNTITSIHGERKRQDNHIMNRYANHLTSCEVPSPMKEEFMNEFRRTDQDYLAVFDRMPPTAHRNLNKHMKETLFRLVPLFRVQGHEDLAESISSELEPETVFEGAVIIQENVSGEEMFFIQNGQVEIRVQGKKYISLCSGSYIGDVSILLDKKTTASVIATTTCILHKLSKASLHRALETNDAARKYMLHVAKGREKRLANFLDSQRNASIDLKYVLDVEDLANSKKLN